jgi:F-type H+-transporting ATPase subunit b
VSDLRGHADSLDPYREPMKLTPLLTAAWLGLLVAAPAAAAPAEEGGGILTPEGGLMFWTLIVFGIVLFVLWKAAFPLILGAVEAREQHLRETIEAAERDRAEAAALLEENRKQLEDTRARVQEAFAESRTSVERMKEEVLAEARAEQEAMLARARRDIAAEREQALDAVRRDTVDLAIAAAERLLRRNLDAEENRRLVREYLGSVALPEPAGAGA